jgi:hypothetical protein
MDVQRKQQRSMLQQLPHVQQTPSRYHRWAGIADFPLHCVLMRLVLDYAKEALNVAFTVDGLSAVVYGYTTRADSMALLEKDWKSQIDIAKDSRQSVSVLAVTTSQPL